MNWRIARKAIPNGCSEAWWYANQNGSIVIYGKTYKGEPFSVVITARGLKPLTAPRRKVRP